MSILDLPASYFAIPDPRRALERCLHRYRHRRSIVLGERLIEVLWTERAARELQRRERLLVVELQLYFSCVVKKRVLFHDAWAPAGTPVSDKLHLAFQAVTSAACDPLEFAASYPRGEQLSNGPAMRMIPRRVELDYRHGNWEGTFSY